MYRGKFFTITFIIPWTGISFWQTFKNVFHFEYLPNSIEEQYDRLCLYL